MMTINPRPLATYLSAAAAFCAFVVSISSAQATSERVKSACKDDYFRHCSAYALGSPSLRQCMRNVGAGLSNPCLAALALDGEITKEDVQRYQSRTENGIKAASNQAAPKKGANSGKTANGGKVVTASKTAKVASVGKTANGGKVVTTSKSAKVASVGKPANGGKSVSTSKTTKIANAGKPAKGVKAGHAVKASDASQAKKP